jgi:putative nucleotidyltransferase with HDIG domain
MATEGPTEDEFFPVHLGILQPGTLAPVNLYIRDPSTGQFILYRTAQTPFTDSVRQRLLERGVTQLYLPKKDKRAYDEYVEENLITIVRDGLLPGEDACRAVYGTSSRVMEDLFARPESNRNFQRGGRVARAIVLSVLQDPDTLWNITSLASHTYFTYTHSVHVATFLVAAGKELLGVEGHVMLDRIGQGGILHDIGKTKVPGEILYKSGRLTEDEFELVKQHTLAGVSIVERQHQLTATAASIIRSHHERWDGLGYPDGLKGEGLRPIVRLAKIVDVYDALTTARPYAPAREPFEALRVMQRMEGHFDEGLLRGFVKFLGPGESRREGAEGPVR